MKLGECVDLLAGFAFKSDQFTDAANGVPLVKGENVGQGRILWDKSKRWPAADWNKFWKFQLSSGDVLIAMDRPWVPAGLKWAYIRDGDPNALLVQRVARLRASNGNLDQGFLRFIIGSPAFENYVKPITAGVNVPHISGQQILNFEFALPPPSLQRRIAGILSAYDDLIDNNKRRIRILEEMARSLYREWFVNFRFPGHEKIPLVNSPLGPIPKGWEVVALGQLAVNVTKGTTPTTLGKEFKSEGINFFKVESIDQEGGIDESKLARIDSITLELLKRSQLQAGDILFSIAGAIGRTTIVPKRVLPANTNQALAVIRIPDENNRNYIFYCVRAEEFQHFSLGRVVQTAQANVSLGILKSAPVVMPPESLLGEFGTAASALLRMQENLRTTNIFLRLTRELLLRRLLSGQGSLEPFGVTHG